MSGQISAFKTYFSLTHLIIHVMTDLYVVYSYLLCIYWAMQELVQPDISTLYIRTYLSGIQP